MNVQQNPLQWEFATVVIASEQGAVRLPPSSLLRGFQIHCYSKGEQRMIAITAK